MSQMVNNLAGVVGYLSIINILSKIRIGPYNVIYNIINAKILDNPDKIQVSEAEGQELDLS
jgi:hypothetical protein